MMKLLVLVAVIAYASADSSREHGVSPGIIKTTCNCGWANRDRWWRIVGGTYYKTNEYPFIVGLARIADYGRMLYPFCGGSIITPNHVITAAHCTDEFVKSGQTFAVILGSHDRSRPNPQAQAIHVASIQQHPQYQAEIFKHDITVLTLASSINFNNVIGPVCLPLPGLDVTGATVRVLGWGAESFQGQMTNSPKKLDSRVVTPMECFNAWSAVSAYNPTQVCTLANKQSPCQGDSGGPVVWRDPLTNRYTLIGLVSFGPPCTDEKPTVHTRVEAYLPWIKQQINANKGGAFCVRSY